MISKFLLSAVALAALAGPAAAQDTVLFHRDQVRVSFKDLDISTPSGAKSLMRRLTSAATQVCGPSVAVFGPGDETWRRECVDATLAAAVVRVNRPMLTALAQPHVAPLKVAAAETTASRP